MSERKQNRASAISFMRFVATTTLHYTLFLPLRWLCRPVVPLLSYRIVVRLVCIVFMILDVLLVTFVCENKSFIVLHGSKGSEMHRKCLLLFLFVLAYRCYSIEKIEDLALLYLWWSLFSHTGNWWERVSSFTIQFCEFSELFVNFFPIFVLKIQKRQNYLTAQSESSIGLISLKAKELQFCCLLK